ncbi:cytochrome P450 [Syncephalastrum racemosum]|uniref:Cytochrome P450 n=1 Tax=Syncephalastrum racemosum TaxID=13706 RepID=A0A1X2HBY6_SYNRA|nr:cytochrome P450 [Syncephalastrum racemosum]
MDTILQLYEYYVLPLAGRTDKALRKHKKISIGLAVALTTVYIITQKMLKPPKALRQVPYVSTLPYLRARYNGQPLSEVVEKYTMPVALKEDHGLYARYDAGGWFLHITTPKLAKQFLLKTDIFAKAVRTKKLEGTIAGRFIFGRNILITNGAEWKKHRKIANPAFHRSMPVELFGQLTHKLFKAMDSPDVDYEAVDFHDLMTRWTLSAIGSAGFGFDFKALEDKDNEWVQTYDRISTAMKDFKYLLFPFFDRNFLWLNRSRRAIHEDLTRFLTLIDGVIENKRRVLEEQEANDTKESERDLLTLMIESEKAGEGALTNEELKSNLCIFFLAGHDTTANALTFAIYYLAVNPDIQEKARQEAIGAFGDDPADILPTAEETKDLQYINCIIKETLRIAPPATGVLARGLTADTEMAGMVFPKGTRVMLNIYELHHNPRVWANPEKFDPDRFLPGGEGERLASNGAGMAWVPFSNGGRQCIGANFSLAEQRVLLPLLLRKFEWRLPEGSPHKDKPITGNTGVLCLTDLKISFKKRY